MTTEYPATLDIDYPAELNRATTFFRLILAIPVLVLVTILSASSSSTVSVLTDTGEIVSKTTETGAGLLGALTISTALMILFRRKYPRWWFDFAREFTRFSYRIGAYLALQTDLYPSTDEEQSVHLDIDYPDAASDLNRWMPLVKWFLAIPHYVVLAILAVGAVFAVVIAWFAILFTGRYPRGLFDYILGVARWALRVQAYAFLLVTDTYPSFSLR